MRKRLIGLAVVGVALLAAGGCGGDDSSLSADEYNQQLELVCNEALQERTQLVSKLTREYQEQPEQNVTREYQAENIRKLATEYQKMPEKIKELGYPEQNPEKVEALVRAQEEASAKVIASPENALDSLEQEFAKPDKLAESLGVKSCTL